MCCKAPGGVAAADAIAICAEQDQDGCIMGCLDSLHTYLHCFVVLRSVVLCCNTVSTRVIDFLNVLAWLHFYR